MGDQKKKDSCLSPAHRRAFMIMMRQRQGFFNKYKGIQGQLASVTAPDSTWTVSFLLNMTQRIHHLNVHERS